MNAHQIRNVLNDEAVNLFNLKGSHKAAKALNEFTGEATDAELIRFRELLIGLPDFKLLHAATD